VGTVRGDARRVYDVVFAAQEAAMKVVRPGASLVKVDGAARNLIAEAGYGGLFGHGTGHGVGLAVHEAPTVSPRSKECAEEGAVFTVEPGIYVPGRFGVRLEDCLVVTSEGYELITSVPKSFGAVWDWSLSGDD
jgi:Xaa-Pro aminopeptidase